MNDISVAEDLLTLNILLYDIDIVDGNIIREFARRSVQNNEKTVQPLRYNNHTCYVSNINAVFISFRCPDCDTFSEKTFNTERNLNTCCERVKLVYPRTYIKLEKLSLRRWTLSVLNTRVNKNFSQM